MNRGRISVHGPKFGRGYAAVVWFEELDQFDGIDAVRSILNSLRRGGDDFWIFYTYNPPRTLWSWVNREELERERRSSYLDVVGTHPEWLGRRSRRRPSTCETWTSARGEASIWAR